MPVKRCSENGKPGYKYGDAGTCYTYEAGSQAARDQARSKAAEQGRAIEANKRG